MLEEITRGLDNVRVIADTGLLVDVVRRERADVILRGLRNSSDLVFEMQMAEANRQIGHVETVYIGCIPEYSMISSTIVRDCAAHGAPIESMVPREIIGKNLRCIRRPAACGKEGLEWITIRKNSTKMTIRRSCGRTADRRRGRY